MPRNNVHVLSEDELRTFKEKYIIELVDNQILVKFPNYKRVTFHDADKPFAINAKKFRKICFSLDAIETWKKFVKQKNKYTLFDVQNAINILYVTYQTIDEKNIIKVLERYDQKIITI